MKVLIGRYKAVPAADGGRPEDAVLSSLASPPRAWSYVLPIASDRSLAATALTSYLENIGAAGDLVVVDGSPAGVFAEHHRAWSPFGRHVRPDRPTLVGKVGNVLCGIRLAAHDRVVIADDDVRYGPELEEAIRRLDRADVVRPQNYFAPLPWHAAWDSGRTLLNRLSGGDWPGTLAVRRSVLLQAGGYAGDALFENYELCKTIECVGGRHEVAYDIFVRRLPPDARHFLSQRVRQAYDEMARPIRMVPFLIILPTALGALAFRRGRALWRGGLVTATLVISAAEVGRRRAGAAKYIPFRCSLMAPLWVAERSVCTWGALIARFRGGVLYRGRRVRRAALHPAERRSAVTAAATASTLRSDP